MEILRKRYIEEIKEKFNYSPVVAIIGPRQCGKTTLARQYIKLTKSKSMFFDLEDPIHFKAMQSPMFTLESFSGLIVIDEVQIMPELFKIIRVLVDRDKRKKFLILGSASSKIFSSAGESLAGRISYIELSGFSLFEIPYGKNIKARSVLNRLWMRGGFPRSYLAKSETISYKWRKDFISTFLERDIPSLGIKIPSFRLRQFWMMTAHYHGSILNYSEIGKSLGLSDNTVRSYMELLESTFMIRFVQPYFINTKKRIVKKPKLYIRDSGIFHTLMSIEGKKDLFHHPKLGFSWEGFAIEQIVSYIGLQKEDVFFWNVHQGAEIDLLLFKNISLPEIGKIKAPVGFEIKLSDFPKIGKALKNAVNSLGLSLLIVVYPGKEILQIDKKIIAFPIEKLLKHS